MNRTSADAEKFALKWIKQFGDKDFEAFKEAYYFAYRMDGMNRTSADAEKFAWERIA